jgi:hypothetical protein
VKPQIVARAAGVRRGIAQLCHERKWALATWDVNLGMQVAGQSASNATDPLAAIKSINALSTTEGSALLVLPNFHRFLQSTEIVQAWAYGMNLTRSG